MQSYCIQNILHKFHVRHRAQLWNRFPDFFQFVVFILISVKIKRTWDTVDYPSTQLLHRTLLLMTIFGSVLGSTLDSPTPCPDNVVIPNGLISTHFAPYSTLFGVGRVRGKVLSFTDVPRRFW